MQPLYLSSFGFSKIAVYLYENTAIIQSAVEKYFLFQHGKSGLEQSLFKISFFPKNSGVQTGFTCDVSDGTQTVRYYIKTHFEKVATIDGEN